MVRLKPWQWVVLALPIATIVSFLLIAAGWQIHRWGVNWIWAIVALVFVGWRWLLVRWTQPPLPAFDTTGIDGLGTEGGDLEAPQSWSDATHQAEVALQQILTTTQTDPPLWEDWPTFWQRCQELVVAIAHIYHPEVKYPLLNIYVPQAYGLIRGTADDMDQWMQKISPALNQMTIAQAYEAYETYRKLEPSARKLWQAWNWAQWLLNPAAAVAQRASRGYSDRASQQLVVNLSQLVREAALRNLCRQAIALYSGTALPATFASPPSAPPAVQTQTLRDLLAGAEPKAQAPVNILLVGRTGAGKSSLINTLFQRDLALVDVLPSTEQVQHYQWQASSGESLILWDTPGYEQVNRSELRQQVLDYGTTADLLLLVTPALDPALQMDVDFLQALRNETADVPAIAIVTQVDRLRPLREWQPPYDWQWGDRPKEQSIRAATDYRAEQLGPFCDRVLPIVTADSTLNRTAWGIDALSLALVEAIDPAKQLRLARFLRDLEARTMAAAQIIERYRFQMATTQGLTALLKSPVLQFIATLSTGSPALAYLLAEKIPVEQLPVVIGKLQMAYDLFSLLSPDRALSGELLTLWPLLLDNSAPPDQTAWAWGHALVEYQVNSLSLEQLQQRVDYYLQAIRTS